VCDAAAAPFRQVRAERMVVPFRYANRSIQGPSSPSFTRTVIPCRS